LIAQYHASAARLIAQLNKVENRARDDFRDLWDCGTEIKNAEVGDFVESRRSDASEAPFRVRGRTNFDAQNVGLDFLEQPQIFVYRSSSLRLSHFFQSEQRELVKVY
jgi:hypothetical protein